jgi:hypothetical protein
LQRIVLDRPRQSIDQTRAAGPRSDFVDRLGKSGARIIGVSPEFGQRAFMSHATPPLIASSDQRAPKKLVPVAGDN